MRFIQAGSVDQTIYFRLRDATTGLAKTGLLFNSAGAVCRYTRNRSTATAITLATLAAADSAHSDGGFKEVDGTNAKGLYRLDLVDAAVATGSPTVEISLEFDGVIEETREVTLTGGDITDAVRMGLTALPNVAAEAAGGLYTRGSGPGQINQQANGQIDINLARWLNTAAATPTTAGVPKVAVEAAGDFAQGAADKVWSTTTRTLTALGASLVQEIWDRATSALTTAGSIGKFLVDEVTNLVTRLTSTRAGYLDNLNVGGLVASSAEATAIQNNTRVVRVVPQVIERPDSGTQTYRIELFLYDEVGNMEAPDSAPTIVLVNQGGTDLSARLDSATMALVETGRYRAIYTASVGDALEQLVWAFSVVEGGVTRKYGNQSVIVDTTAVDFTSADRTKLDTLHDTRLTAGRAANLDNLDTATSTRATPAQVRTEANGAIVDNHLDHLLAVDYDPAAKPGVATALLNELVENDGGVSRYTANALEQGPGGGAGGETRSREGTAQAGAASTITLDAGASAVDNFYRHQILAIDAGTGAGQSQIIDSYVGSTKVATMAASWATAPDATSHFRILPLGTIPGASAPSAATVAGAVWDKAQADHDAAGSMGEAMNDQKANVRNKIVNDKSIGETKTMKNDGTTLRYKRQVQAGATDNEVVLQPT
jgi:hypothetical protein